MTIVLALLAAAAAVALVVLAYAVGRLQGEVRRLQGDSREVVVDMQPAQAVPQPEPVPVELVATAPEPAEPDQVPVITALDARHDEIDLSVSRVASVTLARPLIKVAAFSHGVRRALSDENRFRIRYAMRQELKRQRKMRRRRRAGRAPATYEQSRPDPDRGR